MLVVLRLLPLEMSVELCLLKNLDGDKIFIVIFYFMRSSFGIEETP